MYIYIFDFYILCHGYQLFHLQNPDVLSRSFAMSTAYSTPVPSPGAAASGPMGSAGPFGCDLGSA